MGRITLRYQRSDPGNEFTAVCHRVCERVIAADEEAGGPKIVVGDQRRRDRLRGAYEGCGIAPRTRGQGQGHPQAAIMHLLLGGGLEKPERSIILRRGPCFLLTRFDGGQNTPAAIPRFTFSAPQDGARGQAKGETVIGQARYSAYLLHKGGGGFEWFSPQHVHVHDGGQSGNGGRGAATAVDGHMRDLLAANVGIRPDDPIEFSLMIKRRRGCPGALQQGGILLGAAIARIVVGEISVACLLCVVAPRDQMDGGTSPAQVIQGGELPRRHSGGHKTGSM